MLLKLYNAEHLESTVGKKATGSIVSYQGTLSHTAGCELCVCFPGKFLIFPLLAQGKQKKTLLKPLQDLIQGNKLLGQALHSLPGFKRTPLTTRQDVGQSQPKMAFTPSRMAISSQLLETTCPLYCLLQWPGQQREFTVIDF